MALKYEPGGVLLSGRNRPLTYEAVFIPLRPTAAIGLPPQQVVYSLYFMPKQYHNYASSIKVQG
jgi:hypothetical protein